ncbi:MAG TPA: methylenetetrahydrofolate reductase [NAD(P)H] [Dehalococcoidia bacterium]|nr:methylenetetrahydrofolate reductase [NAD(P)H] [Dehalococcoidia bacterium]
MTSTSRRLPLVSFEFFPPRTPHASRTLWRSFKRLEPYGPRFTSVTYGAGGSTRERTHQIVRRMLEESDIPPAAHLTCVGASRDEVDEVARDYWEAGIRHIVALRGDPPAGMDRYEPHPHGYHYASDLIAGLKRVADFEITAAAYPEPHPESISEKADLDNLKRKIDAGATMAITQFFFQPELYLRFMDRARAAGIMVPIVPGVMPVVDIVSASRFAKRAGASVPDWLVARFGRAGNGTQARLSVAISVATEFTHRLMLEGVEQLHFYTLNRAAVVAQTCENLGIIPAEVKVVD